jgi:hypothetical protein
MVKSGNKAAPPTEELVRDIAKKALCDERSVWKVLPGARCRPKTQARIDRELASRGLARAQ